MASPRLVFTGPDGSCFVRLLSNRPSFEQVEGWVQRKLKLSCGQSFDASYACDLRDGRGTRAVMLDDEEDVETLQHLAAHGLFSDDNVHVSVRIGPAPAPLAADQATMSMAEDGAIPSEEFQRLLQLIAFSSTEAPRPTVDEQKTQQEEPKVENHDVDDAALPPAPSVEPASVDIAPPSPAATIIALPVSSSHRSVSSSSALSPTAPAFQPSPIIPSIAVEAASSLASSVSGSLSSHLDEAGPSGPGSPVASPAALPAAQAQPTANPRSTKPSGLAILARRLPQPTANLPSSSTTAPQAAASSAGGQHSFRPPSASSHTSTLDSAEVAGKAPADAHASATQEADEFLAGRSFEELRWSDLVDTPPRRTVPGAEAAKAHAAAVAAEPSVVDVVVGVDSAARSSRNDYRHLAVDDVRWSEITAAKRQQQAPAAVDHVSASGPGRAAADAADVGQVTGGSVGSDGSKAPSLDDIRLSHYQRQQSPPQNRGASSSSFGTYASHATTTTTTMAGGRFVSSSSAATSHPSPTSSHAPSTPSDGPTPAPAAGKFANALSTPPPAKPIFTGFSPTPSPEQAVVNLAFAGTSTARVPAFGEEPTDVKPNKRVRTRRPSHAVVVVDQAGGEEEEGEKLHDDSTDEASPLVVSLPTFVPPATAPAVVDVKRSITPTGVEYTSLRSLFPSLFAGQPSPKPLARPSAVKSWLPQAHTAAYMREGKCFRCSAVGHVKADCPY